MTANVLPEQVSAFRDAGMDDHVGKPFDPEKLYATVERWLPQETVPAEVPRQPSSPVEFDENAYREVCRYLSPTRLREVLGLLARDTQAGYSEDEEREVIRRLKAFGYL